MSDIPMVTVLIPARNEEADIERCLRAVLAQDHPHDRMEIVLVDGGSTDATASVARRVLDEGDVRWVNIDNPKGTTPSNLNAGLAVARGDYLCRIDARSLVPTNYITECAAVLAERPDVAVAGGRQVAQGDGAVHRGIARALNNRYGMGGARYRCTDESGPGDTVYLGAFRTDDLRDAGGWDEYFATNQDFELNRRMRARGEIWVTGHLHVRYVPRRSLVDLARQYHRFGRWKVRYWRRTGERPLRRQVTIMVVPVAGVLASLVPLLRRPTVGRVGALILAGGASLVAVDAAGSAEPAPASERAVASVAIGVVGTGWLSGIVRAAVSGER